MKSFYLSLVLFPVVISSYGQGSPGDVNQFIDAWHMAATKADAKTFFDSMAEGAIYIGTDATERWTKSEFVTFAKPYFDRGKAWDFKPRDRDVHVTSDGHYVWFSELLERGWVSAVVRVSLSELVKDGNLSSITYLLLFPMQSSRILFHSSTISTRRKSPDNRTR
jgi:hypothetical protein